MVSPESSTGAAPEHLHRWRIDSPNGPTSMGVCKSCGVNKEFKNSLKETALSNGRLRGSSTFTPEEEEKRNEERLQRRRNQKRSVEEKLALMTDKEHDVLEAIANGVDAISIQRQIGIDRAEYNRIRTKCVNLAGNLHEGVRAGIRLRAISLTQDVVMDPLPEGVGKTLEALTEFRTIEELSLALGCSEQEVRDREDEALDALGALTPYHATAIMEVRAMRLEATE